MIRLTRVTIIQVIGTHDLKFPYYRLELFNKRQELQEVNQKRVLKAMMTGKNYPFFKETSNNTWLTDLGLYSLDGLNSYYMNKM